MRHPTLALLVLSALSLALAETVSAANAGKHVVQIVLVESVVNEVHEPGRAHARLPRTAVRCQTRPPTKERGSAFYRRIVNGFNTALIQVHKP